MSNLYQFVYLHAGVRQSEAGERSGWWMGGDTRNHNIYNALYFCVAVGLRACLLISRCCACGYILLQGLNMFELQERAMNPTPSAPTQFMCDFGSKLSDKTLHMNLIYITNKD